MAGVGYRPLAWSTHVVCEEDGTEPRPRGSRRRAGHFRARLPRAGGDVAVTRLRIVIMKRLDIHHLAGLVRHAIRAGIVRSDT